MPIEIHKGTFKIWDMDQLPLVEIKEAFGDVYTWWEFLSGRESAHFGGTCKYWRNGMAIYGRKREC